MYSREEDETFSERPRTHGLLLERNFGLGDLPCAHLCGVNAAGLRDIVTLSIPLQANRLSMAQAKFRVAPASLQASSTRSCRLLPAVASGCMGLSNTVSDPR